MDGWSNAPNMKVKTLYDFSAQPGSGEINIFSGDILTVTNKDVGDGWWEGTNARGESGLFPLGYVEVIPDNSRSSMPPPPPPPPLPLSQFPGVRQSGVPSELPSPDGGIDGDWGEDDWDDDDSQTSATQEPNYGNNLGASTASGLQGPAGGGPGVNKQVVVKKSYNRFSNFVKSGLEDYIIGSKHKHVPSDQQVVVIDDGKITWAPNEHPYNCYLASPKKESKLKGLKSYIAYQLTPSFNEIQVSRRYKHFDWLQARLEEKFITIPIPPLPDKQMTGRYQEDFIRHRLNQLNSWVNRICKHPVLAQSDVWMHFMTCTDEKRWKAGKRKAEKDEFVGANFLYVIQSPPKDLEITVVERKTDHFGKFIIKMDDACKHLFAVACDQSKKFSGPYRREFSRVSNGFTMLADAFATSGQPGEDRALNDAIRFTASTYENIGKLYEDQPMNDFEPLSDILHEYKGVLVTWPEILALHKGALSKRKEHAKLLEEGKVDNTAAVSVFRRSDNVSFSTLAEIEYFQSLRVIEFKDMMQNFIKNQIEFYEKVTQQLRDSLERYEHA